MGYELDRLFCKGSYAYKFRFTISCKRDKKTKKPGNPGSFGVLVNIRALRYVRRFEHLRILLSHQQVLGI